MQSVLVPDKVRLGWVHVVLLHACLKQGDDISIVWILSKREASAIVHEFCKLIGLVLAKLLDFDLLLLFLDVGVLLSLGSTWKTLPWERSFQEIQEHMADGLKIISSGLLISDMSVDTGISGCSSEILTISERNVLTV